MLNAGMVNECALVLLPTYAKRTSLEYQLLLSTERDASEPEFLIQRDGTRPRALIVSFLSGASYAENKSE